MVRKLYMPVQLLKAGSLAKADELIADEAILDGVQLVHVLHNHLKLILYKVLDNSISADVNTKTIVTVNHKERRAEQGTDVCEGVVGSEHALCGSVRSSRRDTLDADLFLAEIEGEANVLLEHVLGVRENLEGDTELRLDVAIISVRYSADVLPVLVDISRGSP